MPNPRRIFLIGMMFSGKSTVGPLLSEKLGWRFLDLDKAIEEHSQLTIADLFQTRGEEDFRKLETESLKQSCTNPDLVIATGGGIVLSEENRTLMRESGTVVFLHADLETLIWRAEQSGNSNRPLMNGGDPRSRLTHLFHQRLPFYEKTAHYIVKTGKKSPSKVVNEIIQTITGIK